VAWWFYQSSHESYRKNRDDSFQIELTTDAFPIGWGAVCKGKITKGSWSVEEQKLHINVKNLWLLNMH